jgi:hypothetical protein
MMAEIHHRCNVKNLPCPKFEPNDFAIFLASNVD